jgi:DDE family transposase
MLVDNIGDVSAWCHAVFPGALPKPQRENLGRAVAALCESGDCHLSALARSFTGAEAFRYRLKRVDRFIGNVRVSITRCWEPLVPLILKFADRMDGFLPILVDHTDAGAMRICYAAVLFKTRALPLCFLVFPKASPPTSQNRVERELLMELHRLIPSRIQVVVVADRGFGRVSLFRLLQQECRWSFVIRVKGTVWITHGREQGQLRQRKRVPFREGVVYHQGAKMILNLVTRWLPRHPDPWFLATDLDNPSLVHAIYQKRMRIEELFRDEKTHLGMRVPTSRQLLRFQRLLFVLFLATLFLLLLGRKVARCPTLVRSVIVRPAEAGFIWLACQTLAHGPPKLFRPLIGDVTAALSRP